MPHARENFATQVQSGILGEVRALAETEGRQLQAILDEALADLIEKHKNSKTRTHVMGAYLASHQTLFIKTRQVTDYLTSADVLAIHLDQIERYGGSGGVRDYGLLDAALYRPHTGHYADLIEQGAALWESLS